MATADPPKIKYNISYKKEDFETHTQPRLVASYESHGIQFYQTDDLPLNKRSFKYKPCAPNLYFPNLKFSVTDYQPYHCTMSFFDRSDGILVNETASIVTAPKGWRSARCEVGISQGECYWEVKLLHIDDNSHVRCGISRREASLEAPVGFDGYSYGVRDKTGQVIHLSRLGQNKDNGFQSGDVIGFHLKLPSLEEQNELLAVNAALPASESPVKSKKQRSHAIDNSSVYRDQLIFRYRSQPLFESVDYVKTNPMEHLLHPVTVFGEKAVPDAQRFKPQTLNGSFLKIYKNGQLHDEIYDLYAFLPPCSELNTKSLLPWRSKFANNGSLGYYPTISCFGGGIAELVTNCDGPAGTKSLDQLYNEAIAEDILYDIIDEVCL